MAASGDRERAEELVLELVGSQADSLLRVARRYSLCHDDAHDAYQRSLEILMRHAERLDPERAAGWLHTVVKHEALAINRSRRQLLGSAEVDLDAFESQTADSPEERMLAADRIARSAEALHGLKPQEVRALWLRALGHSYEQICDATGWTYTKVNRCLAEGRKSFLERYAGIESGAECERLAPTLSAFVDGEADAAQTVALRAHLRRCLACRAAVRGLHDASEPLTIVFPAAAMAAAGGGVEHATSFFVRVYETASMTLHERAASSFLRAQAVIDTVTAGKMAAVAASAAAVAGGGWAIEGAVTSSAPEPRAALLRGAVAGPRLPVSEKGTPSKHIAASGGRAHSRSRPQQKPKRPPRRPPTRPAATTTGTRPSTTTIAAPARASAASAPAHGSASSEFGFEGP